MNIELLFEGSKGWIQETANILRNRGQTTVLFLWIKYKSLSLERHIRYGWSFLPHTLEEYIQILPPQQRVGSSWYQGTADAVYQNVYSIDQAGPDCVLILSGDHIYKMNYNRMIRAHIEKKAAVTVGTAAVPLEQASAFGVMEIDKKGCIVSFDKQDAKHFTVSPGGVVVISRRMKIKKRKG